MKLLRSTTLIIFCLIILLPLLTFNFEPEAVSEIDNRLLAANPFSSEAQGAFTTRTESYINDRIGLRDKMIQGYTVLNDSLFDKMVHPSYSYGKDGYVFGNGLTTENGFSDYHIQFANMVAQIQAYCEDRDVPFVFVFEPAKPAVYSEYIADGIQYDRGWVEQFFAELDKLGVNYLDNTSVMLEAKDAGEQVFNKKYDANHWNYTGAFYGTNAILAKLKEEAPTVHINQKDEFLWGESIMTSLPVSNFPIYEAIPTASRKIELIDNTALYKAEIQLDSSYRTFGQYAYEQRAEENAPSVLVFQGSYMNFGTVFLSNGFREYTMVHDYQNVIDFPYYFNIFKPECVVFEVAEYTFQDKYFSYTAMKDIDYNKPISAYTPEELIWHDETDVSVEKGESLTKIVWQADENKVDAWLVLDEAYDMKRIDGGYEVTVKTEIYEQYADYVKLAIKS